MLFQNLRRPVRCHNFFLVVVGEVQAIIVCLLF